MHYFIFKKNTELHWLRITIANDDKTIQLIEFARYSRECVIAEITDWQHWPIEFGTQVSVFDPEDTQPRTLDFSGCELRKFLITEINASRRILQRVYLFEQNDWKIDTTATTRNRFNPKLESLNVAEEKNNILALYQRLIQNQTKTWDDIKTQEIDFIIPSTSTSSTSTSTPHHTSEQIAVFTALHAAIPTGIQKAIIQNWVKPNLEELKAATPSQESYVAVLKLIDNVTNPIILTLLQPHANTAKRMWELTTDAKIKTIPNFYRDGYSTTVGDVKKYIHHLLMLEIHRLGDPTYTHDLKLEELSSDKLTLRAQVDTNYSAHATLYHVMNSALSTSLFDLNFPTEIAIASAFLTEFNTLQFTGDNEENANYLRVLRTAYNQNFDDEMAQLTLEMIDCSAIIRLTEFPIEQVTTALFDPLLNTASRLRFFTIKLIFFTANIASIFDWISLVNGKIDTAEKMLAVLSVFTNNIQDERSRVLSELFLDKLATLPINKTQLMQFFAFASNEILQNRFIEKLGAKIPALLDNDFETYLKLAKATSLSFGILHPHFKGHYQNLLRDQRNMATLEKILAFVAKEKNSVLQIIAELDSDLVEFIPDAILFQQKLTRGSYDIFQPVANILFKINAKKYAASVTAIPQLLILFNALSESNTIYSLLNHINIEALFLSTQSTIQLLGAVKLDYILHILDRCTASQKEKMLRNFSNSTHFNIMKFVAITSQCVSRSLNNMNDRIDPDLLCELGAYAARSIHNKKIEILGDDFKNKSSSEIIILFLKKFNEGDRSAVIDGMLPSIIDCDLHENKLSSLAEILSLLNPIGQLVVLGAFDDKFHLMCTSGESFLSTFTFSNNKKLIVLTLLPTIINKYKLVAHTITDIFKALDTDKEKSNLAQLITEYFPERFTSCSLNDIKLIYQHLSQDQQSLFTKKSTVPAFIDFFDWYSLIKPEEQGDFIRANFAAMLRSDKLPRRLSSVLTLLDIDQSKEFARRVEHQKIVCDLTNLKLYLSKLTEFIDLYTLKIALKNHVSTAEHVLSLLLITQDTSHLTTLILQNVPRQTMQSSHDICFLLSYTTPLQTDLFIQFLLEKRFDLLLSRKILYVLEKKLGAPDFDKLLTNILNRHLFACGMPISVAAKDFIELKEELVHAVKGSFFTNFFKPAHSLQTIALELQNATSLHAVKKLIWFDYIDNRSDYQNHALRHSVMDIVMAFESQQSVAMGVVKKN